MADNELLELAAKAAGVDAQWESVDEADYDANGGVGLWLKGARSPDNSRYWNPLTDDGDALRLAVKLRLTIITDHFSDSAVAVLATYKSPTIIQYGEDVDAATRRAIVRAAAEIGKGMK